MIQEPNCHKRGCKHYLGVAQPNNEEKGERPVCSAYPDGIPEDIAYGSDKHLEVRKDQTGNYVYENDTIKNVLQFLDSLEGDKGKVMADAIKENYIDVQNWLNGEYKPPLAHKNHYKKILEKFETFLKTNELYNYRNEMTVFLAIGSIKFYSYYNRAKQLHRQTKTRNSPLLKDLKQFKDFDFNILNGTISNESLKSLQENKHNLGWVLPFEINKINFKFTIQENPKKFKNGVIKRPEILEAMEDALMKIITEYYENGTFNKLLQAPRNPKEAIKHNEFATDFLLPLFYYLRELQPNKTQKYCSHRIMEFWSLFYSHNLHLDWFRRNILGSESLTSPKK